MSVISMKQLLEAGVHFGHQTRRWDPKMAPYIYTARNDIHVINLEKTCGLIDEAYNYIKNAASEGKAILFVGTKKQAQEAVKEEATRCGMFYINNRWPGGTLTNFKTIKSRIARLHELRNMDATGEFEYLPKKEGPKYVGAIFETAGQFAYIYALASGESALAAPIISSYCVASVLWSRIFLKEKLSWKHYACILTTILGIIIMGVYDM